MDARIGATPARLLERCQRRAAVSAGGAAWAPAPFVPCTVWSKSITEP